MEQLARLEDQACRRQQRHADQRQPAVQRQHVGAFQLAEQQVANRPAQCRADGQRQRQPFVEDARIECHDPDAGERQQDAAGANPADALAVEDHCKDQAERHAELPRDRQRRDVVSVGIGQAAQPHEQRARDQAGEQHDQHASVQPAQPRRATQ